MAVRFILQPINGTSPDVVREVSRVVERELAFINARIHVSTWPLTLPLTLYNFDRMQYNALLVNEYVSRMYRNVLDKAYLVGIVNADGYVEGLNFVFGTASPAFRVATVYTRRLAVKADYKVFITRTSKVVVHEIGHLLGLGHCKNYCVMQFSNSLAELDEKPPSFCPECRKKLKRAHGG